jgi:hypothetical protein
MFPPFDTKAIEKLTADPTGILMKIADFQRANFEAIRQIANNNAQAFQQLAAAMADPPTFLTAQPAILQEAIQANIEVITSLWKSLGADLSLPAAKPPAKKK